MHQENQRLEKFDICNGSFDDKEPIESINIQKIITQTQYFSVLNIKQQAAQQILVKLLYLLNQSDNFNSVDLEKILCGVSKLFQFNNPHLKRIIYKVLKIIVHQQFGYIFIQSIIKDLLSTNQFIRLNALRVIPYIRDESMVFQLVKYVSVAINDKNPLVSDTAMIAAFSLWKIFPNIPQNFSSETCQNVNDYEEINLFALNLLCTMKKNSLYSFIKIIQQLIRKPMSPQANMQIIRIICKMIDSDDPWNTQELLNYVQSQAYYQQTMVFFESIKQLMAVDSQSNLQLRPYIKILFDYLLYLENNIEIFAALRIIDNLLQIKRRKQLILDQQLSQIESLISGPHQSISSLAILILIQTYQDNMIAEKFKQLYFAQMKLNLHINILEGFLESGRRLRDKSEQTLLFLKQIISKDTEDNVIELAVQIIDLIIRNQKIPQKETMECLFQITQNRDQNLKVMTIQSIHRVIFKQQFKLSNCLGVMRYYYYLRMRINQPTPPIDQNHIKNVLESDPQIPYKLAEKNVINKIKA